MKMNIITLIALILIGLGGLGGILLVFGQARSSFEDKTEIISTTKSENKQLKRQITELINEREKLSRNLEERDQRIQEQNTKIEKLSNKLVDKSEYIEKYISGGDSYPHIELGSLLNPEDGNSQISFMLKNSFDLPIYNIIIEAFDYDNIKSKTFLFGEKNEKAIKIRDYIDSRIIEFKKEFLTPKSTDFSLGFYTLKPYNLYIKIHTRNKILIQKITVIKHDEMYYSGYVVYNLLEKKILEENYNLSCPLEIQKELKEKLKNIPNNITHLILE